MLPQCKLVRRMGRGIGLVTVVMLSFGCTSRSTHKAAADGSQPAGTTASMSETAGSGGIGTGGSTGTATTAATGGSGGAGGSAGGSGGGQAADAGRWDEAEWDEADRWGP